MKVTLTVGWSTGIRPEEAGCRGHRTQAKRSFWAKELEKWLFWIENPAWTWLQGLVMPYPQGIHIRVFYKIISFKDTTSEL